MAKLFLGTREVTPSMYKGSSGSGYSELPAYEVSNGTASKRTKVLDGTEFEGITTIDAGAFQYAFYGKDISGYLNLSSVVTINGNGLNQAFRGCSISSINVDNVEFIGSMGIYQAFMSCSITTIDFKKLSDITTSYCLRNAFQSLSSLTDVYFRALTTTSFGSQTNQFTTMLSSTSGVTLHFPSNLQSTIQGISGYPSFGGTNVTIAFDLPATS